MQHLNIIYNSMKIKEWSKDTRDTRPFNPGFYRTTESGGGGRDTANHPRTFFRKLAGLGMFCEWIEHFKVMAAIKWDDTAKLLWLCVQLVGGAKTVYGCLPTSERELCQAEEIKALKGEALKECI